MIDQEALPDNVLLESLSGLREVKLNDEPIHIWIPLFVNTLPLLYFYTGQLSDNCERARVINWDDVEAVQRVVNSMKDQAIGLLLPKNQAMSFKSERKFPSHINHYHTFPVSRYHVSHIFATIPGCENENPNELINIASFKNLIKSKTKHLDAVVVQTDSKSLADFYLDYIHGKLGLSDSGLKPLIYHSFDSVKYFRGMMENKNIMRIYLYSAHGLEAIDYVRKVNGVDRSCFTVEIDRDSANCDQMCLNFTILWPNNLPKRLIEPKNETIETSVTQFYDRLYSCVAEPADSKGTLDGVCGLFRLLIEDHFPFIRFFEEKAFADCLRQHVREA